MCIRSEAPEVRGRALWFRDDDGALWVGGWARGNDIAVHPASAEDVAVLSACDGVRALTDVSRHVRIPIEEVTRIIAHWEARIPGSLRWKVVVDERLAAQTAVALDMLHESLAVDKLNVGHDNADYHRNRIRDADHQFDEVETTVSHAYSVRHPGLGGRAYGEALFDKCRALGAIRSGMQILEVGCGTGRLARSFLDAFAKRMPEAYANARYMMFDVAPVLAVSQRELTAPHAERVVFVSGNIETHVFHEQFDLVIANEMIADLSVDAVDKDRPASTSYARKYNLSSARALRIFLVNAGAIRFVEQVASILHRDGLAIVVEYGSRDGFPVAVELCEHTEYSIHFGHLEEAAASLGLRPHCESLESFLEFDSGCQVIAADSSALLRGLSSRLFGTQIPKLAYTRKQLYAAVGRRIEGVQNVQFLPIGDCGSLMCPREFLALLLSRR